MSLGTLLWATAHEIKPKQEGDFQGGFVDNLTDLANALSSRTLIEPLRAGTPVNFDIKSDDRSHPVRDPFMSFAFNAEPERLAASTQLCERLAAEMDGRNKECLLLLSAHETANDGVREVIVWMFPADTVIQRTGSRVDLQDAFSLTSGLRKAAVFKGPNARTGFLSGIALDHQSSSVDRRLAEFWVAGFLGASMQVQSREGTALLASAFRHANNALTGDVPSQETLAAAIGQLRARSDKPWTIQEVAVDLLPGGPVREAFLRAAGEGAETRATFRVGIEQFDSLVKYRVFRLTNGVTVSAPFLEIGDGVNIEGSEEGATLVARGVIASETLRSRS